MCFQTCSTFRAHSDGRIFWLRALRNTRLTRPLPCPSKQDLTKLDLIALKNLTRRARDLERNWSRDHPEIISVETPLPHEASSSILAVIPGTKLIITHSSLSGNILCWDVSSRKKVGGLYVSPAAIVGSQPLEEEGKYTIAIATQKMFPTRLAPFLTNWNRLLNLLLRQHYPCYLC